MKIVRHRLLKDDGTPVPFIRSPNQRGSLTPKYLIMHYTAGSNAESSIQTLTNPQARASAHLVIARSGTITQLVPFDRVAWHAGVSRWHGINGLNRHSIGIELDNAGQLDLHGDEWRAWFGRVYPKNEVMLATHKFDTRERGWHSYTEKQIASAVAAAQAIATHYGLIDVLGHDDIAPDRKRDPGPAFPMESFEAIVLGRNTDSLPSQITTTVLNIREGPGTNFTKLDAHSPLERGTRLQPIRRDGSWYFVEVIGDDGLLECTGWVHGDYIVADAEDA